MDQISGLITKGLGLPTDCFILYQHKHFLCYVSTPANVGTSEIFPVGSSRYILTQEKIPGRFSNMTQPRVVYTPDMLEAPENFIPIPRNLKIPVTIKTTFRGKTFQKTVMLRERPLIVLVKALNIASKIKFKGIAKRPIVAILKLLKKR